MPELNTFACDVCGIPKKDTNRWWMVAALKEEALFQCTPWTAFVCAQFDLEFWAEAEKKEATARAVACGEEHAQQLFARWLVSGSFDAPSQRPVTRSAATPGCTETDEQVPQSGTPQDPSVPTRKEGSDV